MDQFHVILFRKIIQIILKITGALEFYKKHIELFQNYILVPVILHLGPCITFYNYDWVPALINLIYFNYLFNLLPSNHYNFLTVAHI
jgi:hypothetical protein